MSAAQTSEAVIEGRVFVRDGKLTFSLELYGALTCAEFAAGLEGLIAACYGEAAAHGLVLNDERLPF